MDNLEIEAKFVIPDLATFSALQQLTHLGDYELKPMGLKAVVDRYLDTANKDLYQAGWACRLRNVSGKQVITLKSLTPAQDEVHRRQELEIEVETTPLLLDQPQAWPDSPVKALVVQTVGPALLQTLFTLRQTRHKFHGLKQGQAVIELSLDEVSVNDPGATPYWELELELIEQGGEADLALLVEALQAQWPLKVEIQSKFERALAEVSVQTQSDRQMEGEQTVQTASKSPKKKKKAKKESTITGDHLHSDAISESPVRDEIGLKPDDTLAEAGREVLSFHFGRMLTQEPGARLGSDTEAVHDMRVATRRMRAAFKVFEGGFSKKAIKPLQAGLRTTGRILGDVRDLDVLMEKLQQYRQSLPESEQAGLQPLFELWLAEREEARREMLAYLDSKKYRRFKRELLAFVTTPDAGPTAHQLCYLVPCLIYERLKDVHAYDALLEDASLDTLHQLRITFKQLRYILEFFEEILGKKGQMVVEEVKAIQDHLGALNDARVAADMLADLVAAGNKKQKQLSPPARQSLSQLEAYLQARLAEQQRLRESFPQAWARFNSPKLRRNLALAIAAL